MSRIGSREVLGIWSKLLPPRELAEIVIGHNTFKMEGEVNSWASSGTK